MVRGKGEKRVLSPGEVNSLKEDKSEIEATLRSLESGDGAGTRGGQVDRVALQKQAEYLGRQIEQGAPGKLRGGDKDRLADRARELEAKIKEGMPSYDQMMKPSRHPGIILKNKAWHDRTKTAQMEWKNIQRQLEPGDPSASSIERLRRQHGS